MMEDIGKIIGRGLDTYTNNLNLGIPFIINLVLTGLFFVIMLSFGIAYIFGASLSSLENATTPEQVILIILPIITRNLFGIAVLVIVYLLVSLFFQSFFTAGAIGMARQATEAGRTDLSTMMDAGKKNVVNLYLAQILAGLLYLAGIVFLVPGALSANLDQMLSSADTGALLLLAGGFLLWIVYILVLSLVLAIYRYSLVVDNLGPVDAIITGIGFFNRHKFDVFLLWLITGAIAIIFTVIGQIMGLIPIMNIIWPFIGVFISVLVIQPLTAVWWTRLYMTRTDKKIYFNELLAHPNELKA
ncbi:hypothetical protein ANME2D_00662 [Candidatus Methanoperedens nitroreducens]|uniref:DUF7847 domain-containing protein n=1 Tax=Candidatus Methanoperedens nitratireducens TaxID=1392998 RepID=A0A062V3D4_9EURY|nr:hypothetical protein [Candidatus Methanoperedens nitroreducens]KCZ73591.1 hypothetical protein ANME2D_00662 [Candidatus Methanoperedens nitroreducens]MDJ1422447.1 hypothetical protein [Candidatus Methanoperedens sp.]